ncbi:hypothetical protein Tco_0863245 [Tanacetum coccineum]
MAATSQERPALTVHDATLEDLLHTILEDMDRYPNAYLEELEAFQTLWDVKPRVEESSLDTLSMDELVTQLRQVCEDAEDRASNAQEEARQKRNDTALLKALQLPSVTHAASTQEETNLGSNSSQNKACNYKEVCAVMHENFRGTEGAVGLTRWFEKLESQFGISNVVERNKVKFASSTLLDSALTWWNGYCSFSTPLLFLSDIRSCQHLGELILLCPEMVPNTDRLLERYIEGLLETDIR